MQGNERLRLGARCPSCNVSLLLPRNAIWACPTPTCHAYRGWLVRFHAAHVGAFLVGPNGVRLGEARARSYTHMCPQRTQDLAVVAQVKPSHIHKALAEEAREPLLHILALRGDAYFHFYTRVGQLEAPAYRLRFKDHVFSSQSSADTAVRCSLTPPSGISQRLMITGVFQPGEIPFSLHLCGYPDLDEEEALRIYCKGEFMVHDQLVGVLAVYRDTFLPVQLDHRIVPTCIFNATGQLALYSCNEQLRASLPPRMRFDWDSSTVLVIHRLPSGVDVHIHPPSAGELWLDVAEDGVRCLSGVPEVKDLSWTDSLSRVRRYRGPYRLTLK